MISFGSLDDVVFILQVNLRERGLAWSSFTAPLERKKTINQNNEDKFYLSPSHHLIAIISTEEF